MENLLDNTYNHNEELDFLPDPPRCPLCGLDTQRNQDGVAYCEVCDLYLEE